uniref:Uncharacterized protein n=1 Tax=Zosterops lateralis melanops TaxID=1220523 RepID=A0A8D2P5Y9_ZOSLA
PVGSQGFPEVTEVALGATKLLLPSNPSFPFQEISLSFSVESRSSRGCNSQLQEAARKKLWALESDDRAVCALFKVQTP